MAFDFGVEKDIVQMRALLAAHLGELALPYERLDPLSQLVRSLIGSRTEDGVSNAVFERLRRACSDWSDLGNMSVLEIEQLLVGVTYFDRKARQLRETLARICGPDQKADLDLLADMPTEQALDWLERFAGVGPKVSAATLNFSTLRLRAFVADTHVLRVLSRHGLIDARKSARRTHLTVVTAMRTWQAEDFLTFHVLVKRLGQTLCQAREINCPNCPLRLECKGALN